MTFDLTSFLSNSTNPVNKFITSFACIVTRHAGILHGKSGPPESLKRRRNAAYKEKILNLNLRHLRHAIILTDPLCCLTCTIICGSPASIVHQLRYE